MTVKSTLKNALLDYIAFDARSEQDSDKKVVATKQYLDELESLEDVPKEWIISKGTLMIHILSLRIDHLKRAIDEDVPFEDVTEMREERRILLTARKQILDFLKL